MKKEVVIIGGGAAGLMCAIEAGRRGRSVAVLEHSPKIGKKILISGGGRCNFTNLKTSPQHFISANPHFCKSALARYTPRDFLALLGKHAISYHEKAPGQLFCNGNASQVVRMLESECRALGVELVVNCRIEQVTGGRYFEVSTPHGIYRADSLVIATGGLSVPPAGATPFGYEMARRFGLKVTSLRPGLVPLTFSGREASFCRGLSGVSLEVEVWSGKIKFSGRMLFTHRGLSGPAILQLSSYWKTGETVHVNFLPGLGHVTLLEENRNSQLELKNLLAQFLPRRFVEAWTEIWSPSKPLCRYSHLEIRQIARKVQNWELFPDGTEGYRTAEVTVGGVDTMELSSKTMEVRKVPNLFFVGEVLDVTGQLGGFNFQWAWSSGYAAGQYV